MINNKDAKVLKDDFDGSLVIIKNSGHDDYIKISTEDKTIHSTTCMRLNEKQVEELILFFTLKYPNIKDQIKRAISLEQRMSFKAESGYFGAYPYPDATQFYMNALSNKNKELEDYKKSFEKLAQENVRLREMSHTNHTIIIDVYDKTQKNIVIKALLDTYVGGYMKENNDMKITTIIHGNRTFHVISKFDVV